VRTIASIAWLTLFFIEMGMGWLMLLLSSTEKGLVIVSTFHCPGSSKLLVLSASSLFDRH